MTPEPQHAPAAQVAPWNKDAEESVLGAMLANANAIDHARERLADGRAFYLHSHAKIYRACVHLHDHGAMVDLLTLQAELERRGELADVGGFQKLVQLGMLAPPSASAAHHANLVVDVYRRRRAWAAAKQLEQATLTGMDVDEAVAAVRDAIDAPAPNGQPATFATSLDAFLAEHDEDTIPFLGDQRNTILPAAGLAIVAGMPGIGKTTLILDLAFHLASGVEWLGITVPRPARIVLVENEGPASMFRQKLREKRELWDKEITGAIYVQNWRWGNLSFADQETRRIAARFCDDNHVDLVVGDPLGTLGMKGVGSPEDTREFVQHLVELGLMSRRSFLLLSHFRKEPSKEEIDQVTGAWGQHLDALLVLKAARHADEVRLSFPKLRWARDPKKPLILGKVRNTVTFEVIGEEGDQRILEQEIAELLADGIWRTSREIASKKKGGLGARHDQVDACLKTNDHLFHSVPGPTIGRHKNATCWQLANTAPIPREHTGAHPQTDLFTSAPNGTGAHPENTAPMRPEHTGAHPDNGAPSREDVCAPEEGGYVVPPPGASTRTAENDEDDDIPLGDPADQHEEEIEWRN